MNYYQGVILLAYFNFDTCISNYIHYNVWDEIIHPFPNLTVQPLKFVNWQVISWHYIIMNNKFRWLFLRLLRFAN